MLIRQLRKILFSREEDHHKTDEKNKLSGEKSDGNIFDCAECEYDTTDDEDENKNDLCIINDKTTEGAIEGEIVSGQE